MGKPIYLISLKSNYIRDYYAGRKVSRKTKKRIKKCIQESYLPTFEELRWIDLPDCKWCEGSGTYRDHPSDSGYGCPDCYATGKSGWKFSCSGVKVDTITGRIVKNNNKEVTD